MINISLHLIKCIHVHITFKISKIIQISSKYPKVLKTRIKQEDLNLDILTLLRAFHVIVNHPRCKRSRICHLIIIRLQCDDEKRRWGKGERENWTTTRDQTLGSGSPTSSQCRAVYTAGFRGNKRVKTFTTLRRALVRVVVVVVFVGKLSRVKPWPDFSLATRHNGDKRARMEPDLLSFSSFTFSSLWYSSDDISISNIVDLMDLENRLNMFCVLLYLK